MKDISAILFYLKGKWNIIFIYIICNLIAVFFSLISLAMLVPFLKMIFGDDALLTAHPGLIWSADGLLQLFKYYLSQLIISHNGDKIWGLLFIIIVVIISNFLKNLFIYFSRYLLHPLRNSIVMKMRINLFQKAIQLPIGFFSNERKGDIISRMTNDVTEVEISIMSVMELLFSTPVVVVFYLMVMLSISAKLCLFLILLLPIAGFIIGRISKSLKKQSTETQEKIGSLLSIIDETLSGLRIVKAFRAETNRVHIFKKENNSIFRINNAIAKKRELASPLSEFLGVSVLCIILWFGGKLVLGTPQEIDGGQFIMFILIFTQLLDPLKKLSQVFYNIAKGRASLERMNKILNAENKIVDVIDANSIESFNSEIEFKNVCFDYEEKQILKNINLKIHKGKTIAIVGSSGSGKSTLVDLIPRFHDVKSGEILLDGKNIATYKIDDLRKQMGIVSQEPILFNDTIANNISLGTFNTSKDEIAKSAQIANAENFILQKEDQYETIIGDRGTKLSGGEKQRLTIARAIFKNPPILILDEATSSLDTVSEKMVQESINELMKNRTSIIIAHRLSTVQKADEIIVLNHGEIVERGTHESLMLQNGMYNELVQMQQLES